MDYSAALDSLASTRSLMQRIAASGNHIEAGLGRAPSDVFPPSDIDQHKRLAVYIANAASGLIPSVPMFWADGPTELVMTVVAPQIGDQIVFDPSLLHVEFAWCWFESPRDQLPLYPAEHKIVACSWWLAAAKMQPYDATPSEPSLLAVMPWMQIDGRVMPADLFIWEFGRKLSEVLESVRDTRRRQRIGEWLRLDRRAVQGVV